MTLTPTIHVQSEAAQLINFSEASGALKSRDLHDVIGAQGAARVTDEEMLARMLKSYDRPKSFNFLASEARDRWLGQTLCLHGSSPDIDETFPELLALVAAGAKVMAVNKAHDWLLERGIVPDFGIMADPKDWVATYQTPQPTTIYLLASQCHDDVFKRFQGHPRVLIWHAMGGTSPDKVRELTAAVQERAQTSGRGAYMCVGGSTTTMRGLDIATFLGFRHVHFFGVASSGVKQPDGALKMHGHDKPHVTKSLDKQWPIYVKDPTNGRDLVREYFSNGPMQHQALHWEMILRERFELMRRGDYPITEIVVHGDGLWPACAAMYGLHFDHDKAAKLRADGYRPIVISPAPMMTINFPTNLTELHHP